MITIKNYERKNDWFMQIEFGRKYECLYIQKNLDNMVKNLAYHKVN